MNIQARHISAVLQGNVFLRFFVSGAFLVVCAHSIFAQAPVRSKVSVIIPSNSVRTRAALIEGNVVYVSSGDSVSVAATDGNVYSVRLEGIDAPEKGQEYWAKSKESLAALIEAMDVSVLLQDADSEAPYLARIFYEGSDVNLMQLENGMAWYFPRTLTAGTEADRVKFEQTEAGARAKHVGLWSGNDAVAPWVYANGRSDEYGDVAKIGLTSNDTNRVSGRKDDSRKSRAGNTDVSTGEASRKYVLGPRGGCYYVSPTNKKVYVKDKSLCTE